MTLAAVIQLAAACIGIVGSLFFAIGVIRQNAAAMARLSKTFYDSNPHMPAVLAAQKSEYVFGGGLIVVAFSLQLASYFSSEPAPVLTGAAVTAAPWVAAGVTAVLFLGLRFLSTYLAKHYQTQVEQILRREQEDEERRVREEREARKNAA